MGINDPLLGGDSKSRRHPILNSILLGCAMFFILYFNTESPYGISSVGSFFIFLIYLTTCLLAPFLIFIIREKITMLLAIVILFITFIINYYIESISLISIIISPIALELLWIAAVSYIISMSEKKNIGLCFGLFFGFTQILSALYSYFLMGRFTNSSTVEETQDGVGFIVTFIIFLIVGIVLVLLLGNPSKFNPETLHNNSNVGEIFLLVIEAIIDKRFLCIIPATLFLGFSGTLSSTYNVLDVFGFINNGNYFLGNSFILGAVTCLIIGFLYDKIKRLILLIILLVISVVSIILSLYYWYGNHENQSVNETSLIYNISMYGFAIVKCGLLIFVYSYSGLLHIKRSITTSAAIRLVQLIGTVISFIIITWVNQSMVVFYIFIILLIISYLSLIYFSQHKHHY